METSNFNGMCRCCASEGAFKDIKRTYQWMGEEEVYEEMIKECFDINLTTREDIAGGICEVCITQLRNASNFKKQVLHTEEQFKKHPQMKFFKSTLVKVEQHEDRLDSDDNIDNNSIEDGFSGNEFDVPIKSESLEEQKPKKRTAKASTSKAKKSKVSEESSDKITPKRRPGRKSRKSIITIQGKNFKVLEKEIIIIKPKNEEKIPKTTLRLKKVNEVHKHINNVRTILLCSNATPIRRYGSIGYACSFCNEEYQNPNDLKTHTLNSHNHENIEKFMEKQTMLTYMAKLDITSLKCALCPTHFENLDALTHHLTDAHAKKFHENIKNHIVPFKFDGELKCVVCKQYFNNFKVLLEHMNTHYGNYVCEVCGKGFINKRILQTHMYRHKTGVFSCSFCEKIYDTRIKQKEHERAKHLCSNKRSKCGYCGEKFTDYTKKHEHEVKLHGVKPIVLKCLACQKTFDNQRSLTVHTKTYHLIERRIPKKS